MQTHATYTQVSMYDEKPDVEGPVVHPEGLPRVFFDITIGGKASGRIEVSTLRPLHTHTHDMYVR